MTDKDQVFKFFEIEELQNLDENDYSHFGWERGFYAFASLADAYRNGANAIYDKIVASKGNIAIIDTLIYPLCFMHRHCMEITLKYLYTKHSNCNQEQLKTFLNTNHSLTNTWNILKPIFSSGKKKVGSGIDIGALEHYISEMNKFDPISMRMRYPIDKKLNPHNQVSWLDYRNLHNCMNEFYTAIGKIDYDIDNQIKEQEPELKLENYIENYKIAKPKILKFISLIIKINEKEEKLLIKTPYGISVKEVEHKKNLFIRSLSSDEKIIFETLFYAGRAVLCKEVRLSLEPQDRVNDFLTICIQEMEQSRLKFGSDVTDAKIKFYSKRALSIVSNLEEAIKIIG